MWEHLLNCVGASMYFTALGTHDSLLKSMVWPRICSGYWENIFVCKKLQKRILISSIWFNCLKWIQMHFIEKCNEKRNSNINIHCALDVEEAAWHFNLATQLLKTPRKIVCSKLLEAAFSFLYKSTSTVFTFTTWSFYCETKFSNCIYYILM